MRAFILLFMLLFVSVACFPQSTAPNIGFEQGTFDGWKRAFGTVDTLGKITVYEGVPASNPFVIYGQKDAKTLDPFGNFPVLCPNGSKYSVQLGKVPGNCRTGLRFSHPFG